ncbi:MAG: hypothetical protein HQ483_08600 [Rhodospirillales bacterium]|nr:hypothetical protein [Rhodospirillales bacterium]
MASTTEQSSEPERWDGGIVVIGCRFNTLEFIERARHDKINISGIVTIDRELAERNSVPAWADLSAAVGDAVPVYVASSYSLASPADKIALSAHNPAVGICVGWQRLLPTWYLNTFKTGVFGMHACQHPLPQGRGRSPINWSVIEGARSLHAHVFRYEEEADSGSMLDVTEFQIEAHDDIHTLQQKCRVVFNEVIRKHHKELVKGNVNLFQSNPDVPDRVYEKRSPEDGKLDWNWTVRRIVDFVRAQTKPYPGAYIIRDNKEFRIWRSTPFRVLNDETVDPGTIVECFADGSLVVAAGDGYVHVRAHELPQNLTYGDRL